MTAAPVIEAAAGTLAVLQSLKLPACLIGGLAVQRWGQPRVTQDVDVTVLARFGEEAPIVDALLGRFEPRRDDARQFALVRRVLLCRAPNGVALDISLAALPFEEEVLERASRWRQVGDVWLVTCSAEDLIIYKLVAGRPQDLADIQSVVRSQRANLHADRVRHWGRQFADAKEEPGLLRPFEDALRASRRS